MAKSSADQLITTVEEQYAKLPALPKNWKEVIVNIIPWIALIFGILGVLGALAAFGILTVLSPFVALGGGLAAAGNGILGSLLFLVSSALLLAAFPGTRAGKISGWNLLFWSEAVGIISSVIAFSVSGVVMALIAFYILFQIKSHYK